MNKLKYKSTNLLYILRIFSFLVHVPLQLKIHFYVHKSVFVYKDFVDHYSIFVSVFFFLFIQTVAASICHDILKFVETS